MIAISENNVTGNINFFKNNNLTSTISTSCHSSITSILFDNYDHVIILCYSPGYLYIYRTNGTFTGTAFPICSNSNPTFINFDSKDRLVVVCFTGITLYY